MRLTAKQQRFVDEYLKDLNASQAAIRAGYTSKTSRQVAYKLLTKVHIQDAIAKAQGRIIKRNEITVDRVVQEYAAIAFANTTDVIHIKDGKTIVENTDDLSEKQKAAISEIQETKDGLRIKFHPKISALDALAKHLGMSSGNLNMRHSTDPELADIATKISGVLGGDAGS